MSSTDLYEREIEACLALVADVSEKVSEMRDTLDQLGLTLNYVTTSLTAIRNASPATNTEAETLPTTE